MLCAERLSLGVEQRLEGRSRGGVVVESALRQAQVVECTQRRRVLGAERAAPPGHDALVQRPRSRRFVEGRERYGQAVERGQRLEMSRPIGALATLQEGVVLLACDRQLAEI